MANNASLQSHIVAFYCLPDCFLNGRVKCQSREASELGAGGRSREASELCHRTPVTLAATCLHRRQRRNKECIHSPLGCGRDEPVDRDHDAFDDLLNPLQAGAFEVEWEAHE